MSLNEKLKKLEELYEECSKYNNVENRKICSEFRDFTYKIIIESHKNKENNNDLFLNHPPYLPPM